MGWQNEDYRRSRLSALRLIRKRGPRRNRPYDKRKAQLIGYTENDGAIYEDSGGFITCSRQQMAMAQLLRFCYGVAK
jgi:hypothetical protein